RPSQFYELRDNLGPEFSDRHFYAPPSLSASPPAPDRTRNEEADGERYQHRQHHEQKAIGCDRAPVVLAGAATAPWIDNTGHHIDSEVVKHGQDHGAPVRPPDRIDGGGQPRNENQIASRRIQ